MDWNPLNLRDTAKDESYEYFDARIRKLPRSASGEFLITAEAFYGNDVDAFRHTYVSGVFTQEYGERVAAILSWLNETFSSSGSPRGHQNMDLWNDSIGRRLGTQYSDRSTLADAVKKALESGELIVSPEDPRRYEGAKIEKPASEHSVIVLNEGESGANEWFFDCESLRTMTRSEFVAEIEKGKFPGYVVMTRNGKKYPKSKKDNSSANNLG